ncbi:MAG: DnaJ domain-containing protein [Candidatus Competibacteraceae bacterium]
MLIRILLIGGLLLGLFWLIRRWPTLEIGQVLRWLALTAAALIALIVLVRGGAAVLLPMGLVLLPMLFRYWHSRESVPPNENSRPDYVNLEREEAYRVLGLSPGASREAIKAAHRRLMQRVHPDHGGSDELAARVNKAKDLLLGD